VSDRELSKALLRLDATELAGVPDVRQQTWRVLERDRRRIRFWTGLTVAAWLLAIALLAVVLVNFGLLIPRQEALVRDIEAGTVSPAQREQAQRLLVVGFQKGSLVIAFSVTVLAVAALSTLALVLSSRRATLRQLNAGLLELSEQLKQLRQDRG
jgi:Fe2+ transport system protein FeoA